MIDGIPLVDAHLHAPRLPTLKPAWRKWAEDFGRGVPLGQLYDEAGTLRLDAFDRYLEAEGVDVALLFAEYSPKATGIQPIDDLVPLRDYNPRRFHLVANLNPHYHHPLVPELDRQLDLGAVALKLHPVHGGFLPTDPALYPVYGRCVEVGVPVVFHSGTSIFPGSTNRFADPVFVDEVLGTVPDLVVVLAHGGRGWWYDAAAYLALARDNVWLELSGLPPQRLPDYYARFDLGRLARKFIFATDWPGVPGGIRSNVQRLLDLGLEHEVVARVLSGNALSVYHRIRSAPSGRS